MAPSRPSLVAALPLFAILLFACGTSGSTEVPQALVADPPATPDCAALGEAACLDAADCTLDPDQAAAGGYRCRDAAPPCETGFRQGSDGQEECEARPGCVFVPARCYCAPGLVCICGGGPPAACIAEVPP